MSRWISYLLILFFSTSGSASEWCESIFDQVYNKVDTEQRMGITPSQILDIRPVEIGEFEIFHTSKDGYKITRIDKDFNRVWSRAYKPSDDALKIITKIPLIERLRAENFLLAVSNGGEGTRMLPANSVYIGNFVFFLSDDRILEIFVR